MASASWEWILDVPDVPGLRPRCPFTQICPVREEGGVFWEAGPHCFMGTTHWEVPHSISYALSHLHCAERCFLVSLGKAMHECCLAASLPQGWKALKKAAEGWPKA